MDQLSGTTSAAGETRTDDHSEPPGGQAPTAASGFAVRGRMRRRARFLRRARELAYRDLGGLVFSLHRFGQRNDALVNAKLNTLSELDGELRALEGALAERRAVTVLREPGIAACARCAAIHSSEDRFCPSCGLALDRRAELPIAGAPPATSAPATAAPPQASATGPPGAAANPDSGAAGSAPATPADSPPPAAPVPAREVAPPPAQQAAPAPAQPRITRPAAEPTEAAPRAPRPPRSEQSTEILRPPAAAE